MSTITSLAWGSRVSAPFRRRAVAIAVELGIAPNDLMSCIAWETGETFSPLIRNGAGSGAVGLIQFMASTAKGLGTTIEALAAMSGLQQLEFVRLHFLPFKGRIKNLPDCYMTILWPRAVGKPDDYLLWSKADAPTTYRQNIGLDVNKDGGITKAEAAAKVNEKLAKGLLPGNVYGGEL